MEVKKKIPDELKLELDQLKQMAQDEKENILTRFVFDGQLIAHKTRGRELLLASREVRPSLSNSGPFAPL